MAAARLTSRRLRIRPFRSSPRAGAGGDRRRRHRHPQSRSTDAGPEERSAALQVVRRGRHGIAPDNREAGASCAMNRHAYGVDQDRHSQDGAPAPSAPSEKPITANQLTWSASLRARTPRREGLYLQNPFSRKSTRFELMLGYAATPERQLRRRACRTSWHGISAGSSY
jgi:hypothetical protein